MSTEVTGPATIRRWHEVVAARDPARLDELLADDVTFHSPVVHTPQQGKPITRQYLMAAMHVFGNDTFRYVRELAGDHDAALEFTVTIDEVAVNGVDLIAWNANGQIVDFKVMLRPLKAVNLIHRKMAAMLQAAGGA